MDVKLQDGTIVRGVPDGITQTELTARVAKLKAIVGDGPAKQPPMFTPSGEKEEQPIPTGLESLGAGMDDIVSGVKQQALKGPSPEAAKEFTAQKTDEKALYEKGRQGAGIDPARIAGSTMFTSPAMMFPGGASESWLRRWLSSGGAGATAGAMEFAPEGKSAGENMLVGGGVGLTVPAAAAAVGKGARTIYHGILEPASEAGQTAIKGRAYLDSAGNASDRIIDLLARNKQIVAGSAPTAAEAAMPAGRAEFSSLGASAARVKPSEYLARTDSQNAARIEALDEFAGNPAKRAAAVEARQAAADPHYVAGTAASTGDLDALKPLLERPSMKSVLNRTETLLAEQNKAFPPLFDKAGKARALSGEEAQAMKLAFDDVIKLSPKGGMDTMELRAMKATRNAYVEWLESKFPDLKAGRAAYREGSAPINQMDVGEALKEKLVPALREEGNQRASVFSQAARDSASTIKNATGQPRFKDLQDVLTGRQLQNTTQIQDDLARVDRNADMARKGAGAGPNALDLATQSAERELGGKLPGLLNRGVMIANAIVARMEGKINSKMAAEMAVEMLDPPKVGEALAVAQARRLRNQQLAEEIVRMQRPAAVGGATMMTQGAQ